MLYTAQNVIIILLLLSYKNFLIDRYDNIILLYGPQWEDRVNNQY